MVTTQTKAHALASLPARAGIGPGYGDDLIVASIRCWRAARDDKAPAQQKLYALLAPHDRALLAPVLHSLMTLWEAALGRPFAAGDGEFSSDERRLLDALAESDEADWRGSVVSCRSALRSALVCTRLMIASLETPGVSRLCGGSVRAARSANEH